MGCEHLLVAFGSEPDGAGTTRKAVAAAVAGYAHLRTSDAAKTPPLVEAMRAELAPLIERIERLEARAR